MPGAGEPVVAGCGGPRLADPLERGGRGDPSLRHGPRGLAAVPGVGEADAELVARRDVVPQGLRPVGVREMHGVGQGPQQVGEKHVDHVAQTFGDARQPAQASPVVDLSQVLHQGPDLFRVRDVSRIRHVQPHLGRPEDRGRRLQALDEGRQVAEGDARGRQRVGDLPQGEHRVERVPPQLTAGPHVPLELGRAAVEPVRQPFPFDDGNLVVAGAGEGREQPLVHRDAGDRGRHRHLQAGQQVTGEPVGHRPVEAVAGHRDRREGQQRLWK